MIKKIIGLSAIILAIWAATLVANYFFNYFKARAVASACTDKDAAATHCADTATTAWPDPSYFYTFSILAIALISFIAFMHFSRELRGRRGAFQDGDVRFAITGSFVTVFFALLSFFSFASVQQPTEVGKQFFASFLNLTLLIVGFYFATTGALEIVRIRENRKGEPQGNGAPAPASTRAQDASE
jgi:hypothetical protein